MRVRVLGPDSTPAQGRISSEVQGGPQPVGGHGGTRVGSLVPVGARHPRLLGGLEGFGRVAPGGDRTVADEFELGVAARDLLARVPIAGLAADIAAGAEPVGICIAQRITASETFRDCGGKRMAVTRSKPGRCLPRDAWGPCCSDHAPHTSLGYQMESDQGQSRSTEQAFRRWPDEALDA